MPFDDALSTRLLHWRNFEELANLGLQKKRNLKKCCFPQYHTGGNPSIEKFRECFVIKILGQNGLELFLCVVIDAVWK